MHNNQNAASSCHPSVRLNNKVPCAASTALATSFRALTLFGAVIAGTFLLANSAHAKEILSCPAIKSQTTFSSSILPPAKAFLNGGAFTLPFPFTEDKRPSATVEEPALTPVDNGCITEVTTPFESGAPYMILGPDKRLWYSAGGTAGGFIGAVETNFPYTVTEYGPLTGGALQLTIGPDGNIWFVEQGSYDCLQSPPSKVGRILTHKPYTITEFPVPGPISPLYGIATGADGNLWFTRIGDPGGCSTPPAPEAIARMLPYPPYTITTFPLPSFGAAIDAKIGKPYKLVAGHDNHLWFNISPYLGRLDPFNGNKIEIFTIPGATGNFADIGPGPASDPDSIWFMPTVNGSPSMGRISTKHPFEVSVWPLTLAGVPNSVEPGPDGNMWFTEGRTGYAMGRFNPSTGEVSEFPIVTNAYPRAATCGPDGNLWYADTQNPLGLQGIPGRLAFVHNLPGFGTKQGRQFCESLMYNMITGQ